MSEKRAYMAVSPSGVVEEIGVEQALPERTELLAALFKGGYSLVWVSIEETHGKLFQTVNVRVSDEG